MDWDAYSFVVRSEYRVRMLNLFKMARTPKQIQERMDSHSSSVCRVLTKFVDYGIVECITPKQKRGRVYQITKKGIEVSDYVKKTNE